jgi:hypothetical protein
VTDAREVARYDVHAPAFRGEVVMYVGSASGALAPGDDGMPVWSDIGGDAHPVLLRELSDAGAIEIRGEDVERRLAALGIRMERMDR